MITLSKVGICIPSNDSKLQDILSSLWLVKRWPHRMRTRMRKASAYTVNLVVVTRVGLN